MAEQQANGRFDEYMRGANTSGSTTEATLFAQLAAAEALARIGDLLAEFIEMVKEDVDGPDKEAAVSRAGESAG